jgi:tetratricopeptide (TPR) repeat protein
MSARRPRSPGAFRGSAPTPRNTGAPGHRGASPSVSALRRQGWLFLFLAVVFGLKLATLLQLKDHILTQGDAGLDTTAYVTLARRVLGGDIGLGPGLYFASPLYAYFFAAVLKIADSFTAVRLVQIALGTGAVGLVFIAANEWFGRRVAWIAAGLAALTGLFTFYETLLLQTALDPFLTAALMASLAIGLVRRELRWYALTGLAAGIQACSRPNVLVPIAAIMVLLAITRRVRFAAAVAVGLAVALTPVVVRNVIVAGSFSPTASHGGLNFYMGNNPDADGLYHAIPGITPSMTGQEEDTRRFVQRATGQLMDDAGVSSYFFHLGLTWIGDHPAAAARLFLRKLSLVFSATFMWVNYSYAFFSHDVRTLLPILFVGPWILMPLGLAGLGIMPASKRLEYLIWASFVPTYAVAVAAFIVTTRFQVPILVVFCVTAGAALDRLWQEVSTRRWKPLVTACGVLVALLLWTDRPLAIDDGRVEERTRMADRLITLGRYSEAEEWARRAAEIDPHPAAVHYRIGERFLAHDQVDAAAGHFSEALRIEPGQPRTEFALGETLMEARRPQEAIPLLRSALEAGVRVDEAGIDLVRALAATGDRDGAISQLRTVRPLRSEDEERWTALAGLANQLEEADLAESYARKAIAARGDSSAAHEQLGVALNLEHRWGEAAREFEEALRLNPQDAAPHVGLAVADANVGLREAARAHVREALRLDPTLAQARRLQEVLR